MYTRGKWKKYGQHIHINTSNTSDEIATVLWPDWMPESEAKANAHLIAAAPDLYEALKYLPGPKSILAEAAYTGGDIPKKWIAERGQFIDGYNQALKDVAKFREQAIAKAEGK